MIPSVRGAQRIRVTAALLASGLATGAVAGGLAGALWAGLGLPRASAAVAAALVLVALVLDAWGPRPPAVLSQVPPEWGRLLSPGTAATLYGARLGVGPLTRLTTWLWWSALAVAATLGPGPAAAAGATFHLVRTTAMLIAVAHRRAPMAERMAAVQRRETLARRLAAVTMLVVAATVLVACSDDRDDRRAGVTVPRPPATTRSASPAATASTTSSTTPEGNALEELLLDATLPGFSPAPDDAFAAGPLDLAAAARAEADEPAERALLETRRFVRGHARAWTDATGDVVLIVIYEFAGADGAAGYLADGREALLARQAEPFAVTGIPDAFGFTEVDETERGSFVGHGVAFARGRHHVLVVAGSDGGRRTPDDARTVASAQAARLP